jgi:hypothetical protein
MSTDTYRTPGRTVDETENERTKIHEAAETKRKQISEREETRRKRIVELGPVPYIVACILGVVGIVFAALTTSTYFESKGPPKPVSCSESVEVITKSDSMRSCQNGWFDSKPGPGNNELTVSCHCGAKPAATSSDGGTP